MKPLYQLFFLLIPCCFFIACQSINNEPPIAPPVEEADPKAFDAELAEKYDADDYGMHQYVLAFLKSGPTPSPDSTVRADLQAAHMANIRRLAEEGKLIVAGPFLDNTELRGIYLFNVKTIEEARALTATDPAIQAGALVMELHPWYGTAALMAIPEISPKLQKIAI